MYVVYRNNYIYCGKRFPCSDNEPFIVFSGGMARGSYGDKFTVSVKQGEKHVTFDFTSRVLDFIVLSTADEELYDPGMF